jgi:hypothetical protein
MVTGRVIKGNEDVLRKGWNLPPRTEPEPIGAGRLGGWQEKEECQAS